MHDDALSRSGIHGARHLWPALGHIGTRVGTRVKSDFERIARRHGGINSIPEEQEVLELMRQG